MDRGARSPKRLRGEAYAYAEAAADPETNLLPSPPDELLLLQYIDRFGVMAVLGRPVLSAGEIRRMITAENIVSAYRDRKTSKNWGAWAQEHPGASRLLGEIEKANNG